MKNVSLFAVGLAVVLCGCAATSLKQTWKAPDYQGGPVQKIAVLVVEERALQRSVLENAFAAELQKQGQAMLTTFKLLTLPEIKADKQAATRQLQEAGADTVLIIRLADQVTRDQAIRVSPNRFSPVDTSFGAMDWHGYYFGGDTGMGTVWGELRQDVYLDSSLHDLKTGKRLWSGITKTVLKEGSDRIEELRPITSKVVTAMRKDGLIR
ncbi:MAG: hypothetical protein QM813_11785 [Verrucomicrobiota bacterium]